jgi:hypothetical protein
VGGELAGIMDVVYEPWDGNLGDILGVEEKPSFLLLQFRLRRLIILLERFIRLLND